MVSRDCAVGRSDTDPEGVKAMSECEYCGTHHAATNCPNCGAAGIKRVMESVAAGPSIINLLQTYHRLSEESRDRARPQFVMILRDYGVTDAEELLA